MQNRGVKKCLDKKESPFVYVNIHHTVIRQTRPIPNKALNHGILSFVVDGREVLAATSGRLEQKERGLSAHMTSSFTEKMPIVLTTRRTPNRNHPVILRRTIYRSNVLDSNQCNRLASLKISGGTSKPSFPCFSSFSQDEYWVRVVSLTLQRWQTWSIEDWSDQYWPQWGTIPLLRSESAAS